MRTRVVCAMAIGLLIAGLLAGCATSVSRQDTSGLPTAENPEFLAHPFRVLALGGHVAGNILQYGLVEPFYFLMGTAPEAVGLSLEERRYIAQRQEEWRRYYSGQRGLVE